MSVVSVKNYPDKIVIGADSQGTRSSHIKATVTKLFQHDKDYIWGAAGDASEIIAYQIFLESSKPANTTIKAIREHFISFIKFMAEMDGALVLQNNYIVVFKKKAFLITGDLYIKEIKENEFDSIGSGFEQANIALYLGHNIKESLEAVCAMDIYCDLPLTLIEINKGKKND